MYKSLLLVASCLLGFSAACKVSSTSFTTTDATVLNQIAFISEFSLNCNEINNLALYAEVAGRLSPVVRIGDKYQVSWSQDVKTSGSSGDHEVRLYDEEGYAQMRKAQRSGEDTQNIKPLATLTVRHNGAYTGSFINSEIFATILIGFVAYIAFSEMSVVSKFHSGK